MPNWSCRVAFDCKTVVEEEWESYWWEIPLPEKLKWSTQVFASDWAHQKISSHGGTWCRAVGNSLGNSQMWKRALVHDCQTFHTCTLTKAQAIHRNRKLKTFVWRWLADKTLVKTVHGCKERRSETKCEWNVRPGGEKGTRGWRTDGRLQRQRAKRKGENAETLVPHFCLFGSVLAPPSGVWPALFSLQYVKVG